MSPRSAPTRASTQLGGSGIEEHIERRNLAVANDDHIGAGIVGRLATRAGAPGQTAYVVESLRFALRDISEVRMGRAKIASKLVESLAPHERARRRVEDAVFGIKLVDRGAAARRVALSEDFLKITAASVDGSRALRCSA